MAQLLSAEIPSDPQRDTQDYNFPMLILDMIWLFADYNEEEAEEERKHDETPSLSFSTTETLSSWMREANVDADIQSYTKSSMLRRDEYFFRIWYYASKLFKE